MNEWRQSFVRRLEAIKKHGVACFEDAADRVILPVFAHFEDFTQANGFRISAPVRREGVRTFKFALSENAYALVTFKAGGMGRVECLGEAFVPGQGNLEPVAHDFDAAELSAADVQGHFEETLDCFVNHLDRRLADGQRIAPVEELVGAGR